MNLKPLGKSFLKGTRAALGIEESEPKKSECPASTSTPIVSASFKRGGPVKKTGLAKVHRGERVLTKKQAKKYSGKK